MILLLLSSLLFLLPIIIVLYNLHRNKKPIKTHVIPPAPGPPGLPFIGNLHQLATSKAPHVYLWQLSKKYGPIMQLKLGSIPTVIISSARLAEEVMKTQDLNFCSRPSTLGQKKITYNCADMVFSPYGDYWRELRKITSIHLLSLKKIQSFGPIRADEISRVVKKISSQKVVNLSKMTMGLGSTLICRIAFGKRYDDHELEKRRFDELLDEAQASLVAFFLTDYLPAFGWVDKLSGLTKRLELSFSKLDSFYQELIDEHLAKERRTTDSMKEEADILDILIHLKQHKSSSVDLNWDTIKALLTDIFIAGTDSSATSIVWTMTALMKEQHVMHKVQSEIRNFIGNKGKVDEDDLTKLPYLKAVVNESFRLYPPAPMLLPREAIRKCTVEGYEIQPKTMVYVNAWAVARDPEYWENPHTFLPERFLNSNIDIKGQDFGVVPFGSGRRICPGMFMGIANVELTLANLLYSFDWEMPHGIKAQDIDEDVLPGVTMHKKNALILVPRKYVI